MENPNGIVSPPSIDLLYYLNTFTDFITRHFPDIIGFIKSSLGTIVGLSIPLSVFLFIGIIVAVEGTKKIRKLEEKAGAPEVKLNPESAAPVNDGIAKRWDTVKLHISSNNPNDWRHAIMEADIILDDLLIKLGYKGGSIGERLKRVAKGDFKTLDQAWEAHLVRNEIAHEGSTAELNQFEANRIIGLYRQVFEEFYHIKD